MSSVCVAIFVNSKGHARQEINVPATSPERNAVEAFNPKNPEYGGVVT